MSLDLEATTTVQPGPRRGPDRAALSRAGPYRLLRPIGRGGMGEVYLAVREDDECQRKVALKLIRPGLVDETIASRFRFERRILSGLDHPNIARLYEGGTTEDGRPFFAMERVDGLPIDHYCDHHRLAVEARLELFSQVCTAVQHAHRNLVVHRDIKPGNILVTAEGIPKLLDFGIAKWLDSKRLGDGHDLTLAGASPMTPRYASPEQILDQPITTAADVYSLGLLLRSLLSGCRPDILEGLASDVLERKLQARELVAASRVFTELERDDPGRARKLASRRATQPARLKQRLKGDLDAIVSKALRQEPARRYGSPEQLADDLRAHLQGQPVGARSSSLPYRAGKFLRRHRWAVGVASLFVLLVMGFALMMAWQAEQISRQRDHAAAERDRAAAERDRAAAERDRADRVLDFMVDLFEVADPGQALGETISAREILDTGATELRALDDQPQVQAALADAVGRVYRNLGLYEQARPLLEQALELRRRSSDEASELVSSFSELATLNWLEGDLERAESLFGEAVSLAEKALGPNHHEVGINLNNLALLRYERRGDIEQAEALLRRALEINERALGPNHLEVAMVLGNLANMRLSLGDPIQAAALYRRELAIRETEHGADHPGLAHLVFRLGLLHRDLANYEQSETFARRAIASWEQVLGTDHSEIALGYDLLAESLLGRGDLAAAVTAFEHALAIRQETVGPDHPRDAQSLDGLGRVHFVRGRLALSKTYLDRALEVCERALGRDHFYTAKVRHDLALVLLAKGETRQARELLTSALRIRRERLGGDHPELAESLLWLAVLERDAGHAERSENFLEQALVITEKQHAMLPESSMARWRLAAVLLERAELGSQRGDPAAAAKDLERVLGLVDPHSRNDEATRALWLRARSLAAQSESERARTLLERLAGLGWRFPDFLELCHQLGGCSTVSPEGTMSPGEGNPS